MFSIWAENNDKMVVGMSTCNICKFDLIQVPSFHIPTVFLNIMTTVCFLSFKCVFFVFHALVS